MWALSELGLDASAGERDVKRAYARRLKLTRPDENPQDFQTLHETYEAALAYVRRAATVADALPQAQGPTDEPHAPPAGSLDETSDERVDGQGEPQPRPSEPAGVFEFDLDAFLEALMARAEDPDPSGFRLWLDDTSADWPFALKAMIADDVLGALLAVHRPMPAANLRAVAATFGFDDVLTAANPAQLTLLHQRIAERDKRERALSFDDLMSRENRASLIDRMRDPGRGGYPAGTTRMIAFVLTNPLPGLSAYLLRYVPFVRGAVVRFLDRLDDGRTDALTPGIAPRALDTWTETKGLLGTAGLWRSTIQANGLFLVAACTLFSVVTAPEATFTPRLLPPDAIVSHERVRENDADRLLSRGQSLMNGQDYAQARQVFDDLIRQYPAPWTPALEKTVSSAYFRRAHAFEEEGRRAEAREAYEDLDRTFSGSTQDTSRMTIASGIVNKAWLFFEDRDYQASYDTYARVFERYGRTRDWYTDRQVAVSMYGQIKCFEETGRRAQAIQLGERMLKAFSSSDDPALRNSVANVREALDALK